MLNVGEEKGKKKRREGERGGEWPRSKEQLGQPRQPRANANRGADRSGIADFPTPNDSTRKKKETRNAPQAYFRQNEDIHPPLHAFRGRRPPRKTSKRKIRRPQTDEGNPTKEERKASQKTTRSHQHAEKREAVSWACSPSGRRWVLESGARVVAEVAASMVQPSGQWCPSGGYRRSDTA